MSKLITFVLHTKIMFRASRISKRIAPLIEIKNAFGSPPGYEAGFAFFLQTCLFSSPGKKQENDQRSLIN
jgi:hypothetical protein